MINPFHFINKFIIMPKMGIKAIPLRPLFKTENYMTCSVAVEH